MVSHPKTPILNCFYHLLWFYFLTVSEFTCLALLAKPYPMCGLSPGPRIGIKAGLLTAHGFSSESAQHLGQVLTFSCKYAAVLR